MLSGRLTRTVTAFYQAIADEGFILQGSEMDAIF